MKTNHNCVCMYECLPPSPSCILSSHCILTFFFKSSLFVESSPCLVQPNVPRWPPDGMVRPVHCNIWGNIWLITMQSHNMGISSANVWKDSSTDRNCSSKPRGRAHSIPSTHSGAGALLGCTKGEERKSISAFLMTNSCQASMCFATSSTIQMCWLPHNIDSSPSDRSCFTEVSICSGLLAIRQED